MYAERKAKLAAADIDVDPKKIFVCTLFCGDHICDPLASLAKVVHTNEDDESSTANTANTANTNNSSIASSASALQAKEEKKRCL